MKRIFTIIIIAFTMVFVSCKKMETPKVITIEFTNITVEKTADDAATITATFDYPGDLSSFTLKWDGDGTLDSFKWDDRQFEAKFSGYDTYRHTIWGEYFNGISTVTTAEYTFTTY